MAKRAASPYRSGRSGDWLKLPAEKSADFVVVGYSRGKGNRGPLGALHVGAWCAGELRYVGRVGTGFNERLLSELTADLAALERKTPACTGNLPRAPSTFGSSPGWWWGRAGPSPRTGLAALGVRSDAGRQAAQGADPRGEPVLAASGRRRRRHRGRPARREAKPRRPRAAETQHEVSFTNLKKIFWPTEAHQGRLIGTTGASRRG